MQEGGTQEGGREEVTKWCGWQDIAYMQMVAGQGTKMVTFAGFKDQVWHSSQSAEIAQRIFCRLANFRFQDEKHRTASSGGGGGSAMINNTARGKTQEDQRIDSSQVI